ncbi:MAG: hypothetical protein J6K70_05215 [Selenomonadales bacterium]|nr:hypothetical protein [Selenomonadales bacterium]
MLSRPSRNFKNVETIENLVLFYQCVNEMTFDYSPDTYKAPTLNTKSLCGEALFTYNSLKRTNALDKHYSKYLKPILEELKTCLVKDKVAKNLLGGRYEKINSLLKNLNDDKTLFESTLRNLQNYLGGRKYYNELVKEICKVVCKGKDQKDLIKLIGDWMAEILTLGYSKQHIYNMTSEFFTKKEINSCEQIKEYFELFSFERKKWDCLTIVDKKIMMYIKGLGRIAGSKSIELSKVSVEDLKTLIQKEKYRSMEWFLKCYTSMQMSDKVEIVRYVCVDLDPYKAVSKFQKFIGFFTNIIASVDNGSKKVYSHNVCLNYSKIGIKIQSAMQRRNRKYEQNYLPHILKMLSTLRVSQNMFSNLMDVLSYHGDALIQGVKEKYVITMLWTSLEMLFSNGGNIESKGESVKKALIAIIQRTYIVKRLKYLHADVVSNIIAYNKPLLEKYSLDNFDIFVKVLFDESNKERRREIQETLKNNPLLRTRLHVLVNESLKTGGKIEDFLSLHKKKIEWHIERIYRARNFLVHAGIEFWYESMLVECLHNYVDFVINYILVKTEAGEYIEDVFDIVEEAKNDNEVHFKLLRERKGEQVKEDNYKKLLFGPSENVLKYYQNHIV